MIPKIVHIISKSKNIPVIFDKILEHNKLIYSDYEFKHWHDDNGIFSIPEFLKQQYPELYNIFEKTKLGVQKSDIARLAILHFYGGIYSDMDILFLKRNNDLINHTSDNMYIAMEPIEQTRSIYNVDNIPCNAFIVCSPKHPIIEIALNEIKKIYSQKGDIIFNVFNIFGNDIITKAIKLYEYSKNRCIFIKRELVYPISDPKLEKLPNSEKIIEMLKNNDYNDALMVHYWIHSNFESSNLLYSFKYDNSININDNMYNFFKQLYVNNKYLNP